MLVSACFYTADIFAPEPTQQRDVLPVLRLLQDLQPDVVTVALDPEASGPDTHYKVLQAVTAALQQYSDETKKKDITVWGYRNVWFRFEPHESQQNPRGTCQPQNPGDEVSTIIPVSLQTISTLNHMFLNSFESQRNAEFPAYEIEGPFCAMSQRVQVQQYDMIETCLGYEWFHKHDSPLIRATRGLVFLREMTVQQLLAESRALRQQTETRRGAGAGCGGAGVQGTEYHDDFARAYALDLLAPGATVVADRLLDPIAPEFLWQLSPTVGLFEETFAVEDDWVVIAMGLQEQRLPDVPEEVTQLRFAADEARRRTAAWRYRDRLVAGPTRDEEEVEASRCAYHRLGLVPQLLRPWRTPTGTYIVDLPRKNWRCAGFFGSLCAGHPTMADDGAEGADVAEVSQAAGASLNPDAAEFRPTTGQTPSLVFGGGDHFLSKYTTDSSTKTSGLRRRAADSSAGQAIPDRVNVQLNQLIVHAGVPERILQIVDENFDQLNVVNLTTALHRLASVSLASKKALKDLWSMGNLGCSRNGTRSRRLQ
eukprot:s4748_g1.t1